MIVAKDVEARKKRISKVASISAGDFEALFDVMEERPVVIRFLDPPLHEFLPTKEADIDKYAGELSITVG